MTRNADPVLLSKAPIDIESTLDGGQAFRWYEQDGGYRGVVGDRVVLISADDSGIYAQSMDDQPIDPLAPRLTHYLGLDDGRYEEFVAEYKEDKIIGLTLRKWPGLRILRQDPWECLVGFIASSTSSVPSIKRNVGGIAATLGERVGSGDRDFAFPEPAVILEAGEDHLRRLGLGFRAPYIAEAADSFAAGDINFAHFPDMTYQEARGALMTLSGVAGKVADCVLALSLDKGEAFPVDRWIKRALVEHYNLPEDVVHEAASKWARGRFGTHAAYANQYLFHHQRMSSKAPE